MKWLNLPKNTRVSLNPEFFSLIRELKVKRNLQQFAKYLGITNSCLQNYIYRRTRPRIEVLKQIAERAGVGHSVIQNSIEWNDTLELLSLPDPSYTDSIVKVNGTKHIDLSIFCEGLKVIGQSKYSIFPLKMRRLQDNKLELWYETYGGQPNPNKIIVGRFIPFNEELFLTFGLIQAEGTKQLSYLGFQFSNSNPELISKVLNYFEKFWSISRRSWNAQVHYWNIDFEEKEDWLNDFWSKKLQINKERVVIRAGTKYRLSKNASEYGVCSLRLNSKTFSTLLLNFLYNIVQPLVETNSNYLESYLRGLFEGDGTLCTNKGNLAYIGLAFNPASNEFDHYRRLFKNIDIEVDSSLKKKQRIMFFHGWKKQYKLLKIAKGKLFLSKKKNAILTKDFLSNQYLATLLKLKEFDNKLTVKEYAEYFGITSRSALDSLNRLAELGFLEATKYKRKFLYTKTKEYEEFLKIVNKMEIWQLEVQLS